MASGACLLPDTINMILAIVPSTFSTTPQQLRLNPHTKLRVHHLDGIFSQINWIWTEYDSKSFFS